MYKILKFVAKLISMLPFCGRLAIKEGLFAAYSTRGVKKTKAVRKAYFTLIIMVLGHSFQAFLGYTSFYYGFNLFIKYFSLLYMIINIAVTFVQILLLFRLYIHCVKNKHRFKEKGEANIRFFKNFSSKEIILFVSITLIGQILFSVIKV